jgi:hypothetical protein
VTTSRTASVWTEFDASTQLQQRTLGYFRGRLGNKFYQLILEKFEERKKAGFSKARLARRIHKAPEQITRLFNAPGNWTIDTVADILLGLGYEANVSLVAVGYPSYLQSSSGIELASDNSLYASDDAQGQSAQKPTKHSNAIAA